MRTPAAVFSSLCLAACGARGGGSPSGDAGLSPFQFPGYDAAYSAGPFTVQPGTEIVMCTFVKGQNATDVDVSDFVTQQSVGGHHLIVYTVDHSIDLPPTPCIQGGQPSWVEVLGSQDAQQNVSLPAGVGFHVKAKQQFVMETHYINATGSALTAQSGFALKYAPAGTVQLQAHAYFIGTLNIDVPPGATFSAGSSCSPPDLVTFYSMQGHEHRYGVGETVALFAAADGGEPASDGGLLYETQQWDAPPTTLLGGGAGLALGPSDRLQVTCDWNNTGTAPLSYPQEMCYAVGLYWPGPGTLFCASGGGTDQCQCGYFGNIDTGSGGSTVQAVVSLQGGFTGTKGDPPASGHPIYCSLYHASDWPAGNLQPNQGAQPWYQADVEGMALSSPTAAATVTFTDVTPGDYTVFCFEDTIAGGFMPGSGDAVTYPPASVTAALGQTVTSSLVLDAAIP